VYESEQQVQKLKDSQVHQDFQIQDPYSIFQVPTQQEEELINWKDKVEMFIQCRNDFPQSSFDCNQSIKRLEAQMSRLINIVNDRNEETLSNTFLTIPIAQLYW